MNFKKLQEASITHKMNMTKNKNYNKITARGGLFRAFFGLPQVRFQPSKIAFVAYRAETNFNLSFIPTTCLHVLRFVKYGHV